MAALVTTTQRQGTNSRLKNLIFAQLYALSLTKESEHLQLVEYESVPPYHPILGLLPRKSLKLGKRVWLASFPILSFWTKFLGPPGLVLRWGLVVQG